MVISRDELLVQAEEFDLNEADIQRDYVFGRIISGFFTQSSLNGTAVLKGRNALRKGYLPMTRFSDDLDFSTPHELDPDAVFKQLNLGCEYARGGAGIDFDIDRNRLSGEQQIDRSRRVYKYPAVLQRPHRRPGPGVAVQLPLLHHSGTGGLARQARRGAGCEGASLRSARC